MAEKLTQGQIEAREAFEKHLEERKQAFLNSPIGCGGRNGRRDSESGILYCKNDIDSCPNRGKVQDPKSLTDRVPYCTKYSSP
ncbi:hypothetical protein H8D36_03855 [archaeon]|nr:hypothetical protein [archaeon]